MAARLPLDDSDDGDSLISGSTDAGTLSRHNSSGDVRKVSPEVLSRQNSNDVSIIKVSDPFFSHEICNFRPERHRAHQDQVPKQIAEQVQGRTRAMI